MKTNHCREYDDLFIYILIFSEYVKIMQFLFSLDIKKLK